VLDYLTREGFDLPSSFRAEEEVIAVEVYNFKTN
jgi:hypothetical protein